MALVRLAPVANQYAALVLGSDTSHVNLDTTLVSLLEGSEGDLLNIETVGDNDSLTAASLDLDTVAGDLDTIVEAATAGAAGNDITITVVGDSAAAGGVTIDEVGNAVTIHFEDGVSTVADVESAITTDATLIAVKTTGTALTVLDAATDECTDEALAGGLDAEGVTFEVSGYDIVCHFEDGVSTVDDFETALAANSSVAALCEVDTAGTAANVLTDADDTQSAAFFLGGGGVASQAAPSASTDGKALSITPLQGTVIVESHTGSGTMTATVKIYCYHPYFEKWFLIKALNGGSAIAETGTDLIQYAEEVTGLYGFTRVAASVATAGTAPLVEVWISVPPLALS